ncbi:coiled coil-containing protein [Cryptosporidium hominis]
MLKKIFGKKNEEGEDGVKPVKANLGEENKFYYNKELKSWVVRGEEHLVEQKQNLPPPPPKRPTTTDSGTRTESMASFSSGSQSTGIRKNLYTSTPGLNIMKNSKEQIGGIIPAVGFNSSNANATLFGPVGTPNNNNFIDNLDNQSGNLEPGKYNPKDLNEKQGIQEQIQVRSDSKEPRRTSIQGKEPEGEHLELSPSSFEGYSGEISGFGRHLQEDQNISVPSSSYTNFTNQSSANTISITNRVLPPIPSLPNAAISNRDLTYGVSQRRASVQDSPLSFISTPNVIQNPKDTLGEKMEETSTSQNQYIHQEISGKQVCQEFDYNNIGISIQGLNEQQENMMMESMRNQVEESKMNSTISNSESDQTEILYTQNDMRQRQRIRPLSQRSAASNGVSGLIEKNEQIDVIKEKMDINWNKASSGGEVVNHRVSNTPKMESSILELISFFGFKYDEKSQKLLDNLEYNENMNINEQHYSAQKEEKRSLTQVCIDIKENKLKQMNFLVGKVFKSLQDSSTEYDSLLEMILNIGNITNKTFQEISGTVNTIMSNSDEIEKELIKTRGLYLDLVKKYKAIYKQYETDMITLRSELENEKNMNITNSKEFEEKLKRVQDEFSSNEASNNELLHQYYSYIQDLQHRFEEMQENMQEKDLKIKISEEEIQKLKSEIEELRIKLEEKKREFMLASEKLEGYERENQRLRESNEELISLSKLNEENSKQERIVLIEEHKQELELMEKFSREQDEHINQLQKSIGDLSEERSELLNQSEQLRNEIMIIKAQVENLVEEKSKIEEEVLTLSSQNQDKSSRIIELESMIGTESQRMETVSREMEELKGLKSQMEQKIEEIEKEKIQIESELRLEKESSVENFEKLSKELEEMTLKSQSLMEASKDEMESERRKLKEELESKTEEYNKHINWLESEISRVDEEWRTRQTHIEANYEQLYAQYMDLSSREGELGTLQERVNELESEKVNRNEYISELETKLNESQNDNRVSELEERLKKIEIQNQDNSDKLKESEEEILRGKMSISELEARLESETGRNKSLSDEVESLQNSNGTYLARIEELERRLESTEQYKDYMCKLEQRTLELESSLEVKCKEYDSLEEQHNKLINENKELERLNSHENNHQMKLENEKLKETNEAVYIKLEAFSRDIDMLNNQLEWVRRYSPQVYEAMLENTYQYSAPSFGSNPNNPGAEHEISDIAL